jgi:hypothetical protein
MHIVLKIHKSVLAKPKAVVNEIEPPLRCLI